MKNLSPFTDFEELYADKKMKINFILFFFGRFRIFNMVWFL